MCDAIMSQMMRITPVLQCCQECFSLLHTTMSDDLEPLDPSYVQDILSKPPFVVLPGVINVRDLGGLRSLTEVGMVTRPRYMLRSAEVASITEEGWGNYLDAG